MAVTTYMASHPPLIQKALDHNLGERIASDMLEDLMNDELWLLAGIDEQGDLAGVLVAEEIVHPQKKELYVHAWATQTGYGFLTIGVDHLNSHC